MFRKSVVISPIIFMLWVAMAFCLPSAQAWSADNQNQIIVPVRLEGSTEQQQYFLSLLTLFVEQSYKKFGHAEVTPIPVSMNLLRQLRSLQSGDVHVVGSMTSASRERDFRAIYFPLTGGLYGYRVLLVNKSMPAIRPDFSIAAIKNLTCVQSIEWPDYDILVNNGFHIEHADYADGFTLVARNMADCYPRASFEVMDEIGHYPALTISPEHALFYSSPMYFFVNKANTALAKRLTFGAEQAFKTGQVTALLTSTPFFNRAAKVLKDKTIHPLHVDLTKESKEVMSHEFVKMVESHIKQNAVE